MSSMVVNGLLNKLAQVIRMQSRLLRLFMQTRESNLEDDLLAMIEKHEGFEPLPYHDTVGKLTVGFGHNLDNPMSEHLARLILKEDIKVAIRDLIKIFPELDSFTTNRKYALTDMCFNMGLPTFKRFRKMITAVNREDWDTVAREAENSLWYTQVGNRGKQIVAMLKGEQS